MDKSELKLGEETLDRDHEELHALITRLLGASADDMVPALDALRAHAAQLGAVGQVQPQRPDGASPAQAHAVNATTRIRQARSAAPGETRRREEDQA